MILPSRTCSSAIAAGADWFGRLLLAAQYQIGFVTAIDGRIDRADLFFCGPDGAPRAHVEGLIVAVGLRPQWVGGPEEADVVDGVLRLWFTLVVKAGRGRRLAFKTVQE